MIARVLLPVMVATIAFAISFEAARHLGSASAAAGPRGWTSAAVASVHAIDRPLALGRVPRVPSLPVPPPRRVATNPRKAAAPRPVASAVATRPPSTVPVAPVSTAPAPAAEPPAPAPPAPRPRRPAARPAPEFDSSGAPTTFDSTG